jgi:hypothetical protein
MRMPVEMIGWIAPRVSSEIMPPSGAPFDAGAIAETARLHERAGATKTGKPRLTAVLFRELSTPPNQTIHHP